MRLINIINNVKAYLQNKGVVINEYGIVSVNSNNKFLIKDALRLFDLGKEILVLDDSNTSYFFSLNLELLNKESDFEVSTVKYPFILYYKNVRPRRYGVLDFSSSKKLFELEKYFGRDIILNYIFNDDITCHNIFNGEILWHFDISQLGQWESPAHGTRNYEVKDFVGVYKNQLLVQLSNFKLIGIDVNTGKLINEINLGELYATEPRNFLSDHSKMSIDDANGKIIWLTSASLIHINIEDFSSKLVCNYFHEDYTKVRRFEATTLYKSKLYFTGKKFREGGDPDWVGVMEPNTGEILWEYPIENGNLYEAPQVTDTHLYVRDTISKTLYIFE